MVGAAAPLTCAAGGGWCSFLLIAQADWWPTFVVGSRMVVKLANS